LAYPSFEGANPSKAPQRGFFFASSPFRPFTISIAHPYKGALSKEEPLFFCPKKPFLKLFWASSPPMGKAKKMGKAKAKGKAKEPRASGRISFLSSPSNPLRIPFESPSNPGPKATGRFAASPFAVTPFSFAPQGRGG
jgi:hypothetical protein